MTLCDPDWQPGWAPYQFGRCNTRRAVPGKLSWYQPVGRCHYIAFFSMAIGVLNYPDLDWRFVSGTQHTVPVGYGPDGRPRVVMDILLFGRRTADESIQLAQQITVDTPEVRRTELMWETFYDYFVVNLVPVLKARARELAGAGPRGLCG
jgi:hypothetical protein